jgi:hypothetical protein
MTLRNQTALQRLVYIEDEQLNEILDDQVGISVDTYKAIRFAYRFIGIAIFAAVAVIPAASLTATQSLVLGALVLGPDAVEAYLTNTRPE